MQINKWCINREIDHISAQADSQYFNGNKKGEIQGLRIKPDYQAIRG